MRTSVAWIQSHPHKAILRHISNTVISFFCYSIYYLENRLLPNDLIIVRNYGDDEEDERDIKRALERQGVYVQDAYQIGFGGSTYAQKEDEITFPMEPVPGPTKIGLECSCRNNFNI
jgi:hypothetical protein